MTNKNIYTVRVLDVQQLRNIPRERIGKLNWVNLQQKDVSWSAEIVMPDFNETDQFDVDIIFDDDFRKTTDVNIGDQFDISFSCSLGIHKVEVVAIRKDKPINHLQNKLAADEAVG